MHVRNDDYWREGANIESTEIFGITDPIARVSALISGDVTMVNQVDPKAIARVNSCGRCQHKIASIRLLHGHRHAQ